MLFAVASLLGAVYQRGFVLARSEPTLRCSNALHDGLCLAVIYPLGMKLVFPLDAQTSLVPWPLYPGLVRDADRWALPLHIFAWRNCRDVHGNGHVGSFLLCPVGGCAGSGSCVMAPIFRSVWWYALS